MSIVPTNVNYNSYILRQNLTTLIRTFPFLNLQVIGNSILGDNLYVVKLGRGPNHVFYSASYHSNEWITSVVLMKFIEDYANAYVNNSNLLNTSVRSLFNTSSIFIMPMVNPDGVNLVTGFFNPASNIYKSFESISNSFPSVPFPSGWKANFNGVDLKNFQPICKVL